MKHILTFIFSIAMFLCVTTSAFADQARPYFSLIGGLDLPDEMALTDSSGDYLIELDPGFFAGGALGYDLGDDFPQIGKGRIELEFGFRYNELVEAEFATGTVFSEGDLSTLSIMLNTIGEYPDYNPNYVPYVGLGAGMAMITMNETTAAGSPMIDDDSIEFAYQVLAGLSFPYNDMLTFDLGYRYFATLDPEFTDARNRKVETETAHHNFEIALRLSF